MNSPLVKRIIVSSVPIDCFKVDDLHEILSTLIKNPKNNQIIFLTYQKFLHAKHNKEFLAALNAATLIVPVDRTLVWAVSHVIYEKAYCFDPYDFILNILILCDTSKQSVYLMGANRTTLQKVYGKLKDSFIDLLFVGRHVGKFKKEDSHIILETIRKASPTLVIFGGGIKEKEKWVSKIYSELNNSISIFYEPFFNIISGKTHHEVIKYQDKKTGENVYASPNNINFITFFSYLFFIFTILLTKKSK